VTSDIRASTDWWWIIYPSHFPDQEPDFAGQELITGGMSVGPDGRSPAFVIDDLWLVRVPPHLGKGEYTQAERRAFLPQWLQHEFFHHLYRTYPDLKLESQSHQWFNRNLWPADFDGVFEADYYAESIGKRLRGASPPLHIALRYAPPQKDLLAPQLGDSALGQGEEMRVRELIRRFADLRNVHDGTAIAALYTEDGEWFRSDGGNLVRGRQALAALWSGVTGKVDRLIESVHFTYPDIAVVRVTAQFPDPVGRHHESFIAVKQDGIWYIRIHQTLD
jgi:uncharacterized protein (TIGR02246 family)